MIFFAKLLATSCSDLEKIILEQLIFIYNSFALKILDGNNFLSETSRIYPDVE